MTSSRCKPDDEEDGGDEVVAVAAHVAHHAAGGGRDGADGRNGDEDADGKERRDRERPPRRDAALLVNEADDQRDAGQVARAEEDAEDAPHEGGRQGEGRRALDGVGQRCEELLHDYLTPIFGQLLLDLRLREEADVPEDLLAVLVEEDLDGNRLDAVAGRQDCSSPT